MLVGIISDTHGLMRPEAITALHGADLIIHAGDVGKTEVIDQLNAIAPTHAVRGNVDTQSWARTLPDTRVVEAGGMRLFVSNVEDPVIAQLNVTVVVHAPILAGRGARTALAKTAPRKSVERQTAAIENLMRRIGCSLGLTRHWMENSATCRDASLLPKYNFFILEVVKAHAATSPKVPRTIHCLGDGSFRQL